MGGKSRKRPSTDIPDCKYGVDCYQKNPQHHKKFRHPESVTEQKNANSTSVTEEKNNSTPEKKVLIFKIMWKQVRLRKKLHLKQNLQRL
ncbi:hypothetical protein TNIN_140861 [Trichonephila inaurata madagascariensis]|uniref:PBZ-type domain-containing protein n=1 Tax=Trichonephila inaurata madagascariensis TaxID=2747483 RepID=A0A8X6IGB5_9ARAC|nr:hypothetical protein TNIN_140861 [Trichonephila inaurata madagascariensis]